MINVLHVVLGLEVGGLEKFVTSLAASYHGQCTSLIACLESKGEIGTREEGLAVVELNKRPHLDLEVIGKLCNLVTEHRIDVIHTHNPGPHLYGGIAGFLTKRPVVHTKHGRNYPDRWKKVLLNRLASFFTVQVVAVSRNAAEVCLQREKVPPAKVGVILNGVDTSVFTPVKSAAVIPERPVRIGIVARLSAEKDHETLLRACKIVADTSEDFMLEVVGDGPLADDLERLTASLGLKRQVSFRGTRHDIPAVMQGLDVFVLSSKTEGISLTLLEAMATGLPVVATDVGGNPEVVVDGVTGFLVPSQDPLEMASKLLHLIEQPALRHSMGAAGRSRVVEEFSMTETARRYADLYRRVTGARLSS